MRFTGKERDGENTPSLDYFGARYYGGVLGRFTGADEPFAGQETEDPQSWNLYSYGLNNPLRFVDPDGHSADDPNDPCHGNPNCVTVTAKAQGLNPIEEMLYRSLFNSMQSLMQLQQAWQSAADWIGQPRNGPCLSASTAAGASAGAGVGLLGFAAGPTVGITEPTAMAIGGGIGWAGGMISCMSNTGGSGSSEANTGSAAEEEPTAQLKKLSSAEIRKLEAEGGAHRIKSEALGTNKGISQYDLYKDTSGKIYATAKGGVGEAIPTGLNINNF